VKRARYTANIKIQLKQGQRNLITGFGASNLTADEYRQKKKGDKRMPSKLPNSILIAIGQAGPVVSRSVTVALVLGPIGLASPGRFVYFCCAYIVTFIL